MSLFKNIMMRKPDESSLRKALVTDEYSNKFDLTLGQNNYSYEMDGGALLHKVSWVNGSNLKKIVKMIETRFGETVPVTQIPLYAILHWIWQPQEKRKLF